MRFWRQEVDKEFALGADGFMQDFGEEVLYAMHFQRQHRHDDVQRLPTDTRARAGDTAYEKRHPARRLWFLGGHTGLPGSAAFEGGNIPGDEATAWDHGGGLASLTSEMLGRAVDGAYGYGPTWRLLD